MGHVTCFGQLNVTVSLASWVEAFGSLNSQQALSYVPSTEENSLVWRRHTEPLNGKELPWSVAQPHDRQCKREINILTYCNFVFVTAARPHISYLIYILKLNLNVLNK